MQSNKSTCSSLRDIKSALMLKFSQNFLFYLIIDQPDIVYFVQALFLINLSPLIQASSY